MRNNRDLITGISLVIVLFFLTIGYALYEQPLKLNGNLGLKKPGTIEITGIEVHESNLPSDAGSLSLVNGKIELQYSFKLSQEEKSYTATYLITVDNNSPYDYNFSGFNLEPSIEVTGADSSKAGAVLTYEYADIDHAKQVNIGEIIPANDYRIVVITIHFDVKSESNNAIIGVGGGANVNTSTDDSGTFYGGLVNKPVTLDLTGDNTLDCFQVDVTNTYKMDLTYNFSLINQNFILVDSTGNPLGDFQISAPSETRVDNTQRVNLCIMEKEGAQFPSETEKTQVVIHPLGLSNFSVGTININVDKDEEIIFNGLPELSDLSFSALRYNLDTENNNNSSLITSATWTRTDNNGFSMDFWTVELYGRIGETDTLIETFTVGGDEDTTIHELSIPTSVLTSTNFTNTINNNGSFYIRVYGTDVAGYSGKDECGTTGTTSCISSSLANLKYQFNLTVTSATSGVNITATNTTNNQATVYLNNPFSTVLTITSSNNTINGVTVTKGSGENITDLNSTDHYNYAQQSGSSTAADLTIKENVIDDDINISVKSYYSGWSCLIKGTKIKVLGGYKNIEDIKYDDLLEVYSYELGKVVYEYPIKIEKEGKTNDYQRITFSDGTTLDTFSTHGIFNKDLNQFVSVLDSENFHIGTTVLKIENGKFKEVKVLKIENIHEDTTYYHIASTRYLNVLANDFLTTDPILPISNIFSFNDDLTWGNDREEYLKTNDFIPYEYLKDYFPKYLYDGIRMHEAKHLINQGIISVEEYVSRFSQMNFVPIPTDENGNNLWMVTTSLDILNNEKGKYYQEGSIYQLPKAKTYFNKEFLGWYNTGDNKYYQEGDKVLVSYGMYFEAVYKDIRLFSIPSLKTS